jgi:hypothetical protein
MAFALGTDIRPVGIGDHKAFIRKGTLGATTAAGAKLSPFSLMGSGTRPTARPPRSWRWASPFKAAVTATLSTS